MQRLIVIFVLCAFISGCGTNQQSSTKLVQAKNDLSKAGSDRTDSLPAKLDHEVNMWKMASYAGSLGDNKNSYYITNTYAIWGTYKSTTSDNTDLKVKFLIDRVSFCFKLYEYGKKVVTKGDETVYKITIKAEGIDPLQINAKNVSDRIFINEVEAKTIVELLNKGKKTTFSMVTDSKTSPASYAFVLDHPEGLGELLKKFAN